MKFIKKKQTESSTPETVTPPVEDGKVTVTSPKIITCVSVVPGNGAKHSALNLAFTYKQKFPEQNVALVDLDFNYSTMLGNETSYDDIHGIDNLLDKIDSQQLTSVLFRDNLLKLKDGVFFLKGTQLKSNHIAIDRTHVEMIFNYLRQDYDRVFVSVSGLANNSGTVYGLKNSDCVLMILNNNYTNFVACPEQLQLIKRYFHHPSQIFALFNKFNANSKTEFGNWLFNENIKVVGAVSYDEKTIDGIDWFGGILSKAKKTSKKQSPYEIILDKLV